MSQTMPHDRAAARVRIERFARESPGAVLYDGERSVLLDVASGKSLPIDWGAIAALEEGRDRATGRPYLQLTRDDGRRLLLTDAGIAFEPVAGFSGTLEGVPQVVCLRDLATIEGRLQHFLSAHAGEAPDRAHLDMFRFCLAAVEGARAIGLDVGAEERRLERLLSELESRGRR